LENFITEVNMSKTIYFNLGTTFNYQVVKALGVTQKATNSDNNDKNIIIANNNFTKVSNAPDTVKNVWQKDADSWFVYDGTDLWTLSNGVFSKTIINMKANFEQGSHSVSDWMYSPYKNIFYHTYNYSMADTLCTLSGNNYSVYTDLSSYVQALKPTLTTQYGGIGCTLTADGPWFFGAYVWYEHSRDADQYYYYSKTMWSSNGTSWNSSSVRTGIVSTSPNRDNIVATSCNGMYLLFDVYGRWLGSEYAGLYGTNPSNLSSCDLTNLYVYDDAAYMAKIGNYYYIGNTASSVVNGGLTSNFSVFKSDSKAHNIFFYNNKYYDMWPSTGKMNEINISNLNTNVVNNFVLEENPSILSVTRDNRSSVRANGLISGNKVFCFITTYNSWYSCNLDDLIIQND